MFPSEEIHGVNGMESDGSARIRTGGYETLLFLWCMRRWEKYVCEEMRSTHLIICNWDKLCS